MGHDNVWVLDGGLPWARKSVEKPEKERIKLGISNLNSNQKGKTTEQILANIDSKQF
jgi:hypothetical protein